MPYLRRKVEAVTERRSLTAEQLREILRYDPETGLFVWAMARGKKTAKGKAAGSLDNYGYIVIRFDGSLWKGHRLAWLYMTGEWPVCVVDHKNGICSDNRWNNLREASKGLNAANSKLAANSRTGFKGVSKHKKVEMWVAQITVNQRNIYLGLFRTPQEAHSIYIAAAKKYFGEFANDGGAK